MQERCRQKLPLLSPVVPLVVVVFTEVLVVLLPVELIPDGLQQQYLNILHGLHESFSSSLCCFHRVEMTLSVYLTDHLYM